MVVLQLIPGLSPFLHSELGHQDQKANCSCHILPLKYQKVLSSCFRPKIKSQVAHLPLFKKNDSSYTCLHNPVALSGGTQSLFLLFWSSLHTVTLLLEENLCGRMRAELGWQNEKKQIMVPVAQRKTRVQDYEMQKCNCNKITRKESLRVGVEEKKKKPPTENSAWITRASGMEESMRGSYCGCDSPLAQSCPTLFDPMNSSMPGFLVLQCLLDLAQTHAHWVSDATQPSHLLLPPSLPALNLS